MFLSLRAKLRVLTFCKDLCDLTFCPRPYHLPLLKMLWPHWPHTVSLSEPDSFSLRTLLSPLGPSPLTMHRAFLTLSSLPRPPQDRPSWTVLSPGHDLYYTQPYLLHPLELYYLFNCLIYFLSSVTPLFHRNRELICFVQRNFVGIQYIFVQGREGRRWRGRKKEGKVGGGGGKFTQSFI